MFGFTKSLSIQLQGTNMDIIHAYQQVGLVSKEFEAIRSSEEEEFGVIYKRACEMAHTAERTITKPRTAARQTLRGNVEADTPETYWRRTILLPFIDCLINQLK